MFVPPPPKIWFSKAMMSQTHSSRNTLWNTWHEQVHDGFLIYRDTVAIVEVSPPKSPKTLVRPLKRPLCLWLSRCHLYFDTQIIHWVACFSECVLKKFKSTVAALILNHNGCLTEAFLFGLLQWLSPCVLNIFKYFVMNLWSVSMCGMSSFACDTMYLVSTAPKVEKKTCSSV